jgi:aldose 1-epimerase
MQPEPFGVLEDGTEVQRLRLAGGRLSAWILTYGAIIQDLVLDTDAGPRRLVLGFDRLEDYVVRSPYFGCIAGRYANRIKDGRFRLDGDEHQLSLNEKGRTHLHGGFRGFDKHVWKLVAADGASVDLRLESPDGEEGYPGRLEAACRYEVTDDDRLKITLGARADAPTIVNLTGHSYFNLDGEGDILDHRLRLPADRYTPVDADLIPTGELAPVEGTRFDFRSLRPVRSEIEGAHQIYDHNWALGLDAADEPRLLVELEGRKGVRLEIWSTEPGLQFYDGSGLDIGPIGLDGAAYGPNAGMALEPQRFPDSPNRPNFTDAVLRPGDTYRHCIEYRLFG